MVRTIYEMEEDDDLGGHNISEMLAFCIVAGDYMRARRRRFPLNIISKAIGADGFMQEYQTNSLRYYCYYNLVDTYDYLIHFIYSSHKEYLDD